ncbi:hypothetical protein H8N03_14210 [Ramlibacter sp. USB13]|uniref:Uncharacterized protein n=1 Tax=Ramlibacter cellulosilyticus TaxID=2764187 RepID=A0A923MUQ3_9BURK|nr:hypothetical protein [Ramlibacter cellulosilyticus]MBC5784102.1 hypothetical protein [Ramlibacter cellulosilyticus]
MGKPRRSDTPKDDDVRRDGAWRPSLGLLAAAVVVCAGGFAWWASAASAPAAAVAALPAPVVPVAVQVPAPAQPPSAAPAPAAPAAPAIAKPAEPPAPARIVRNRDPYGDQTPDLSDYVNPGELPTMAQVIERLHQAGVRSGLGAFSPPGTRPPLVGLAVPEDFALPEGYVRHYQATDDGQRIEPILMFAPDRPVFDAAGNPVTVPESRVVPPELAPPGLPLRRIAIPAPVDPAKPRS